SHRGIHAAAGEDERHETSHDDGGLYDRRAADQRLSSRRFEGTQKQFDDGGSPRSAPAKQTVDLSRGHSEADVIDRDDVRAESFDEMTRFDHCAARGFSSPGRTIPNLRSIDFSVSWR